MAGKRNRGRPVKGYRKDKQYRLRLTEKEDLMLGEMSVELDMTKADIFRQALLNYYDKMMLEL